MQPKYVEQIFNDGVDESAEGLVGMGRVDRLVNGEFRREGGITKRNGFAAPTSGTVGIGGADIGHTLVANGGALTAMRKLDTMPFGASLYGDESAYDTIYAQKQSVASGHVESVAQVRDGRGFRNASVGVGTVNGVDVVVVVGQALVSTVNDSSDEFTVSVFEVATGAKIAGTVFTGRRPRVLFRGSVALIFFQFLSSGSWRPKVLTWNAGGAGTFSVPAFLDAGTGTVQSDYSIAPCNDGTSTFVGWIESGGGLTVTFLKKLDASGAITAGTFISANTGDDQVSICQGSQHTTLLWVLYGQSTVAAVKLTALLATLPGSPTVATATTVLTTADGSARWRNIHIADMGTTGTNLVAVGTWDSASAGHLPHVVYASVTYTQGVSVPSAIAVATTQALDNMVLHADPMMVTPDDDSGVNTNTTPMLLVARWSDTPATQSARTSTPNSCLLTLPLGPNFNATALGSGVPLLAANALVDAAYQGAGSNLIYTYFMTSQVTKLGNYYYVALLELEEAPTQGSLLYGIRVLRYTFNTVTNAHRPLPRATLGDLTYIGGNILRFYDGGMLGEAVPLYPPPAPTTAQTTGGFLDLLGAYTYSFVLVWEDGKGLVHRSAPTPSVTVTLTGSNCKVTLDWSAEQLFPSALNIRTMGFRTPRLEVYRSEGNGSTLYLEQTVSLTELTATSLVSTLPDSGITSNKTLYTTGSVLANEAPPPMKALTAVGNRLFGIHAINPRTIVHSKEVVEGFAAEFNGVLSFRLEASESAPVALAGMGDLLVMFTKREAWAVSTHGGPDALGAGTFGLPERLATDCGASSAEAACSTPLGVLVHGSNGFRMLTPGGAVDVPAMANTAPGTLVVRRSMHVPQREEVWFLMSTSDSLANNALVVFSYARGQLRWSTWEVQYSGTKPDIRDMVNADGTVYLLIQAGLTTSKLLRYDTSTYQDQGAYFIPVSVRTRWFKPDGHMGDCRFWKFHVFGTAGVGGLQAKVYVLDVAGSPDDDDGGEDFLRGTFTWTSTQLLEDDRQLYVRGRLRDQRGAGVRLQLDLLEPVAGGPNVRGPVLHTVGWDFGMRGQPATRGNTFEGS